MKTEPLTPEPEQPLRDFRNCHAGILSHLQVLGELPGLIQSARQAREGADRVAKFFREAVFEHHRDEEAELFPAVRRLARKGPELERVDVMIRRLKEEHRELESVWKSLEGDLKKAAKGQDVDIDAAALQRLVSMYRAHAEFEEVEFLPLSQEILGRDNDQLAALGWSLHIRHQKDKGLPGYI